MTLLAASVTFSLTVSDIVSDFMILTPLCFAKSGDISSDGLNFLLLLYLSIITVLSNLSTSISFICSCSALTAAL